MKDEYFYDCIGEFLETSFHCILYIRGVYPSCLFSKSIKYDIPVPISRSDILSRYISNSIDSLKPHFLKDTIEKVSLTILNKYDKPIEKFIFEISPPSVVSDNNNNNNDQEQQQQTSDNIQILGDEDTDDNSSNYYINIQKQNLLNVTKPIKNTNATIKPNLVQLESSFKAYIMKLLMTTDSFYNPTFYKVNSSGSINSNNGNNHEDSKFISNSDGVIHFNEKDDKNYVKQQDSNNNNNKKKDSSKGEDDDKELKFTIHVYTKQNNNNNNNNINLNADLPKVLLNINPLEAPKSVNTIVNQITPVWIPTTKKESEIENSFIIPLNSNITDGKNSIRTFTEQSITK